MMTKSMSPSADFDALVQAATEARKRAYAKYSSFAVGAAIEDADGAIYAGCNIENASYGLTICAERVAVGNAVAAGSRKFTKLAVALAGPGTPCGACRQVLAEFSCELQIVLVDPDANKQVMTSIAELLPMRFEL